MNEETKPENKPLSRREAIKRMAKTTVGICAVAVSKDSFAYGIYYSGGCKYYYSYHCGGPGSYHSCREYYSLLFCDYSSSIYNSSYNSHYNSNYNSHYNSNYNSYCSYCSQIGSSYYSISHYCSSSPQYCSARHYHSATTYCSTC